ncbi:hypothetical protein DEO72_LG5g890 [Vigna unguiculata]|uniref:Uncharacterized protein n=1 Tax=Vigna unguiculata TaxID=3917 RepID=A0A4D6LWM7_VIGUN|nr:hypothetical protein DEO72_LG5g890 [Vigna unguiculata]
MFMITISPATFVTFSAATIRNNTIVDLKRMIESLFQNCSSVITIIITIQRSGNSHIETSLAILKLTMFEYDLLSPHPPRPDALLLPLHSRNLHLPSVTTLPSHKLQRRSHLHRSHAPSNLVLPKTVNATTRTDPVYAMFQWRCSVEELELQGERREK